MTFEEFFKKKKIDLVALHRGDPGLFTEFKLHFEQMGEKSFDHTKKYWFNKLRQSYHTPPEPKIEKPATVMPSAPPGPAAEAVLAATEPAVGFKPRFKAGIVAKPAETPQTPKEEGVMLPPAENTETPAPAETPKVGFKPRFKAGMVKSADKPTEPPPAIEEEKKETNQAPALDESAPKPAYKPRFNMKNIKPKEEE